MDERSIPDAALRDKNSVELLRVWIAEKGMHCAIKVGMYRDGMGVNEENAWGRILADIVKHLSVALSSEDRSDEEQIIKSIQKKFNEEIENPTAKAKGGFREA